eukprot:UN26554
MCLFMDRVYHTWLRRGMYSSTSCRIGMLLLMVCSLLDSELGVILSILVGVFLTINQALTFFYTYKYWKKGVKQYKLWMDNFDLGSRSFIQLRGLIQLSVLGVHYDNFDVNYFCGSKDRTLGDNFLTYIYCFAVLVVPLLKLGFIWGWILYFMGETLDAFPLHMGMCTGLLVVFPCILLYLFNEIEYKLQHVYRRSNKNRELVKNKHVLAFCLFINWAVWVIGSFSTEWA